MFDNKVAEKALAGYHLYVARRYEIPEGVKYSFYSSRRGYLFIYTDMQVSDNFAMIDPLHYVELSPIEREWLNSVVGAIVMSWASNHTISEEELLDIYFGDVERRLQMMREVMLKGNGNERDRAENGTGDISEAP